MAYALFKDEEKLSRTFPTHQPTGPEAGSLKEPRDHVNEAYITPDVQRAIAMSM
ncbi:hypothetical protein ACVWY3_003063 [Bradyrhizobium sp. USDA 4486]